MCFRNRERADFTTPNFTMLEWYRAGEPTKVDRGCMGLLARTVTAAGSRDLSFAANRVVRGA